jgi:Concanavalin A-like lectin/glucanases superfamily
MKKRIFSTTIVIGSAFAFFLLYFSLITSEEKNYNNNSILRLIEIFAQEEDEDELPVIKNSKIINFTGANYADVVNSRDISLNSFTISTWFNTNMNVTGRDVAFLINKGGIGTELPGFNLNYGLWLNNREQVTGGFETSNGDDYYVTSQGSYAEGVWHNTILTFDEEEHMLKLFIDGLEVTNNSTSIGITPDTTGKQPVRLGANSFEDKGEINGNYTGQLDDIQVWEYAFTNEQVASLFDTESNIPR